MEWLAHEFNLQDVANTVWATTILSIHNPDVACRFFRSLSSKLVLDTSCIEEQHLCQMYQSFIACDLCQMHQFFIACDLEEGGCAQMPGSFVALQDRLGETCKSTFVAQRL